VRAFPIYRPLAGGIAPRSDSDLGRPINDAAVNGGAI
jgi:hypothetical protein